MKSTREINNNFLIKVYGHNENGERMNMLVGVSGLVDLVGEEFAEKFIEKAFQSDKDATVFRLRRGIKITFYVH